MTASSTPRSSRPKPKPETVEEALTLTETLAYKSESKGGQSIVYEGVNLPGYKAGVRIIYLSTQAAKDLGTPARLKITVEALPD